MDRLRHRSRCFSVFPDEEGMYLVKGRLTPEVAAALMRAVEAASDALFAESSREDGEESQPAQLRADALGLVAERALAVGFGNEAPVSGSRAERYQVMRHVEEAILRKEGEPGQSELEDGTRVTAETARRLACDSGTVEVRHDRADGSVLDVGRGQVVVFTPLGKALFEVPEPPKLVPDPVNKLVRRNRERGIRPGGWSGAPRWKRDSDVPWAIEAAALEALDPWEQPGPDQSLSVGVTAVIV